MNRRTYGLTVLAILFAATTLLAQPPGPGRDVPVVKQVGPEEVRRVGDNQPIYVNVRVVAAANEPLEKKIKEGSFREDLYYRLNVIPIPLPSLRERRDDIPLLVSHFLRDKIHPRTGKPVQVTRQAIEVLCAHDWPGNVRELENAFERACALSENHVIEVSDLPHALHKYAAGCNADTVLETRESTPPQSLVVISDTLFPIRNAEARPGSAADPAPDTAPIRPLKTFLREQEVAIINRAIAQTGGDKEKAAELLGVSLATLYRKLSEDEQVI